MFGEYKPVHSRKSENLTTEGMCIISDKVLTPKSNIKITINSKHNTAENSETWEDITVDGEVVWVDTPPGIYSKMGIKFKIRNIRCWFTKKHTWDEPETKMTDQSVIKRFRCTRWLCDQNMIEQMTMEQYLLSTGMPAYKIKQYFTKHLMVRMKENVR